MIVSITPKEIDMGYHKHCCEITFILEPRANGFAEAIIPPTCACGKYTYSWAKGKYQLTEDYNEIINTKTNDKPKDSSKPATNKRTNEKRSSRDKGME